MSAKRTERLLNLTMCLLSTRRYLTKDQIRRAVPSYAQCASDEAFERMFERDKDELRELGIPLETGGQDAYFEDEVGYRIDRSTYALPAVSFAPDELAVLALAARAWSQASVSGAAHTALLKLRADGVDPDLSTVVGFEPRLGATDPAFTPLWSAVLRGQPVTFDYRSAGASESVRRRVEPWHLLVRGVRWYVIGHDRDRDAARMFRLSRITSGVKTFAAAGSVHRPPDEAIREHLRAFAPPEPVGSASVLVRTGGGAGLRRSATRVTAGPQAGWDRLMLPYGEPGFLVDELVAHGPEVVAEGPPEIRAAVLARLRQLAASP
ncbi:MAG: helix-turn-helix transcriptional regulator [Sporichthyaceae bacterium]